MRSDEVIEGVAQGGGAQRVWGENGHGPNVSGEAVNVEEDGPAREESADLPSVREGGEVALEVQGQVDVRDVLPSTKTTASRIPKGKPPKNQFVIWQKFLRGIEQGLSFYKSAELAGSSHDAIEEWRKKDSRLEKELQELLARMKNERIEKYLDYIRAGHFPSDAAILSGIQREVMRRWARDDPEIEERVQVALVYFKDVHLRAVQDKEVAKNKGWVPHAWMLERRFPHEYGQHNTVTVDGNVAKEMEQELNAGRERARKHRSAGADQPANQRGSQLLQ